MRDINIIENELQDYVTNKRNDLLKKCNGSEERIRALGAFHNAYYEHRQKFGSYKPLLQYKNNSYYRAMIGRYDYMYSKGLEELLN